MIINGRFRKNNVRNEKLCNNEEIKNHKSLQIRGRSKFMFY